MLGLSSHLPLGWLVKNHPWPGLLTSGYLREGPALAIFIPAVHKEVGRRRWWNGNDRWVFSWVLRTQGFSSGTADIFGWVVLCGRGCWVPCQLFSHIHGLCSLDPSNTWSQKCPHISENGLLGTKLPLTENPWFSQSRWWWWFILGTKKIWKTFQSRKQSKAGFHRFIFQNVKDRG